MSTCMRRAHDIGRLAHLLWSGGLAIGLAGCAAARNDVVMLNPGVQHRALADEASVLLTTMGLERSYEELGMIHVSGVARMGYDGLNEKLRREARRMGADAVIYVNYGTENLFSISPIILSFPYDVLYAEGIAVRTK